MKKDEEIRSFERPPEGRRISGVAVLFAERLGLGLGLVRAAFVLGALVGISLAVAFGIFDHALFEGGGGLWTRLTVVAVGTLLVFLYPLLALIIPDGRRPRMWDMGSAVGVLLLLLVAGQGLGSIIDDYWEVAKAQFRAEGAAGLFTWVDDYDRLHGFGPRDAVLMLFFLSAGTFLWLQRDAVLRFFRSMQVGVPLVILTTVGITAGVLVPQIDGFEDPERRVDLLAEREDHQLFKEFGYQKLPREMMDGNEQYQAFRWAEGYFLYHLLHPYGIGMPEAQIPQRAIDGLAIYGEKYGHEEASNREKEMRASFAGQDKVNEIGAFIQSNEDHFWRFFEASTFLQLNRAYKSHWFTTLLGLLGCAIAASAYRNWKPKLSQIPFALAAAACAGFWVIFLRLAGALQGDLSTSFFWALGLAVGGFAIGMGVPRRTTSLQKLGFFVVHNGLIVLLIGGLTSKLFTVRGIMHMDLREGPKDQFYAYHDPRNPMRLPFAVGLQSFARKEWRALEAYFFDTERELTSRPPRYTLWPGKVIDLDYKENAAGVPTPRLRVKVVEIFDRAELDGDFEIVENEEAGLLPLAALTINDGHLMDDGHVHEPGSDHSHDRRELLSPLTMQGRVYIDPLGGFRLGTAYGEPFETVQAQFPGARETLGTVRLEIDSAPGDGRTERIVQGQKFDLPGGFTVEIMDATNDFRVDRDSKEGSTNPLPLADQAIRMRALWVDINLPDSARPTERRLLVEGLDAKEVGLQGDYDFHEVFLSYRGDDWESPGPPRFLLTWDEAMEEIVLLGEEGSKDFVREGDVLPLPGTTDTRVGLQGVYVHPHGIPSLNFLPPVETGDGWDADFYSRDPRGVILDVIANPESALPVHHTVRLATMPEQGLDVFRDPVGQPSPEGGLMPRFALRYLENTESMPFEWRSVLRFFDKDGAGNLTEADLGGERAREIRVNDYLTYQGYRFFQTNADPKLPNYSGIGVVYDPGIEPVLIGMYTIIAGTAIAFLVRPVLGRRKTPEVQSQAPA